MSNWNKVNNNNNNDNCNNNNNNEITTTVHRIETHSDINYLNCDLFPPTSLEERNFKDFSWESSSDIINS